MLSLSNIKALFVNSQSTPSKLSPPMGLFLRLTSPYHPGAQIFLSELIWREFYRHLWFAFPRLKHGEPFREQYSHIKWRKSPEDFLAWQEGRTGIPLIDAAMRCFKQSRFMHNRLRMVTASFLTKNLLLDWHVGENYFLTHLIDAGDFIRPWVPELSQLYNKAIHEKWVYFTPSQLKSLSYISPICDLASSRVRAIEAYARMSRPVPK